MDWPKCEECEGSGKGDYEDVAKLWWRDDLPCPACNGTGERDLTADQAAEYLWTQGYIWVPERNHPEGVEAGQVKRILLTVKKYDPEHRDAKHGRRLWGFFEGDNLTEALQNGAKAVRGSAQAVKERGKE